MSNPTPILNNINAFDATKGTTISFNIIGGTDIVRSNIVYIYDLSTNELICTHLYISTESIHELPPNTDPSIVYASGKSSADFVNNKNYYLQIQTFTNTAGTAGGSGMSVAKTFWCLFDPALSVNAIPAAISTTSYNVGATYTTNITDATIPVTNIIQQYKFDLYTATGTLVQTSGNIIGSGEQEGTSTTYNITYNFSGLVVNNSYYVVVTTTSTEGMTVSAQSNTFTVSIDTPTLGEATVVNNACDGYISVTSNLSGEYGGSASGKIATFETDSVNDVSSLKVTLTPQQDATPWIGTDHDTTPYLHRAMPTQSNDYNRESGVIVGGTVAWNQMLPTISTEGWEGENSSSISVSGTIIDATFSSGSPSVYLPAARPKSMLPFIAGHKYLGSVKFKSTKAGYPYYKSNAFGTSFPFSKTLTEAGAWKTYETVAVAIQSAEGRGYFGQGNAADIGLTYDDTVSFKDMMFIDLTQLFGTTIADYIYSLEQATAGAGVAWFRKYFPEDYYPYHAVSLESVQATAHKTYDSGGNVIGNYALDSSLTLRGIPRLDASNNLYYDGDTYASDGTVTRKYKVLVFDGVNRKFTGAWGSAFTNPNGSAFYWSTTVARTSYAISNNFIVSTSSVKNMPLYGFVGDSGATETWTFILPSTVTTLEEANAWLVDHPTTVIYRATTPTTETATAYTNPQIVDPDGTEEYVTANSVPVGHDSTYSLVCPISGYDEVSANVTGVNVWDEEWESGYYSRDNGNKAGNSNTTYFRSKNFIPCLPSTTYYIKQPAVHASNSTFCGLLFYDADQNYISARTESTSRTFTTPSNAYYMTFYIEVGASGATYQHDISINYPSTDHDYHSGTSNAIYTATLPETVYGGTVDLVSGEVVIDRAIVDLGTLNFNYDSSGKRWQITMSDIYNYPSRNGNLVAEKYIADITATTGDEGKMFTVGKGLYIYSTDGATAPSGNLVYALATPQTIQLTPQVIRTLVGTNNVWSEDGDVEITYNIPITNLLVKRQDVADVSGTWLTLYSQPITQASDMDFTFIDFLNQYGKTYRYALVPLLTQQQGDVDVEIEGGYTVSDDVLSVFDGVFVANSNGSQKLKASTEYGDLETNQDVGVLTTIGGKYPFVVSNSNLNYHSGSISALIVPSDFYTDGDLDRLSIVERREAIEKFLTDKTAKILKDWNGNIWLITFVDNVEVSFVDDYGMGLGTLSAKWVEIGDVNDQTDLQQTGLI